jgi:hypothetical protein
VLIITVTFKCIFGGLNRVRNWKAVLYMLPTVQNLFTPGMCVMSVEIIADSIEQQKMAGSIAG